MTAELLDGLLRANLTAGAAILLVLALRRPVRRGFGARAAYRLWSLPPLAALASLLPSPAAESWASAPFAAVLPGGLGPAPAANFGPALQVWIAAGWAIGAAAVAAALAHRQRRFVEGLGSLSPVEAGGRLVFRSDRTEAGPAVVGARIVLPVDFEARFTRSEQAAVLAHEAMHLARGDVAANLAAALAQCLCWFNPLVHLAAFQARLDQELACDAAVLEARPRLRRSYAEALLKTQIAPDAPPAGCTWPSRAPHPLKERISMLKLSPPSPARRRLAAAALAALCAGAGYAAWAAQPGAHVITRPDWVERPTGADLVRFYPAEAAKQHLPGEAIVECRVAVAGTLSACHVLREAPMGAGFGEATLQMTPLFRMKPMTRDGKPVAGASVRIPVAFRLAPESQPLQPPTP